ncbi:hypothetical protein R1flu_004334 [Riccia fluitans]|uniref:RING-type domain-containing protein n=1 Tax=Riccia fluitans TaxID=41844 RepID=A0ABD1YPZ3_9MARC
MNVHKAINKYSAKEKENTRKELWRMQVKFEGELCEPIDPDSRKRHRTLGSRTSKKRSHKSENTELEKRAKHTEAVASGPNQVPMDQGPTHMPSRDAPADPSPVVDKGKAKVDEKPKTSDEKYLEKLEGKQVKRAMRENIEANRPTGTIWLEVNLVKVHGKGVSGSPPGHGQGGMDSPCPPRPTTQVEEDAENFHNFVDRMLHDFKIANQEHDGLQKRLEEAEKRLKDTEALHAKIEDIEQFEANMDAYPELKHALEQHKDMTKYKTYCSVYGDALGFLPYIEAGICKHTFHFNYFWEYASTSQRCPICRVPYLCKMYDYFALSLYLKELKSSIATPASLISRRLVLI